MEKDYINSADGLLYCGKCRTPKQCRITAFGNESIQYCICQCEQNRLAEEKARHEEQKRQQRKSYSRTQSKKVDLILEMSNDNRGHITGSIEK